MFRKGIFGRSGLKCLFLFLTKNNEWSWLLNKKLKTDGLS